MKKVDVLTIGSAVLDHTFYTKEVEIFQNPQDPLRNKLMAFEYGAKILSDEVITSLGGGALNTGAVFQKLGLKVGIRSCVGSDPEAEQICQRMLGKGLNTKWIQLDLRKSTGFSFIVVEPKDCEHIVFAHHGANQSLELPKTLIKATQPSWVYLASLRATKWKTIMENIFQNRQQGHIKFAWNPGTSQLKLGLRVLKSFLRQTDLLSLNLDEATELAFSDPILRSKFPSSKNTFAKMEFLSKEFVSQGSKIVVITNGSAGACVGTSSTFLVQKSPKVRVKDTTGAGDGFSATFVGLLMKDWDLKAALSGAIMNAASIVQTIGAQEGILSYERIHRKKKS